MFDALTSSYFESVSSKIPVHRILVFVCIFSVSIFSRTLGDWGSLGALLSVNLDELFSGKFLALGTVADLVLATAVVVLGVVISRFLANGIFFLVDRSSRLRARLAASCSSISSSPQSLADRKLEIEVASDFLKDAFFRVKVGYFALEVCFCLAVGIVIFPQGNFLIVSGSFFLFLIFGIFNLIRSINFFLIDCLPLIAFIRALQGRPIPGFCLSERN